MNTRRAVSPVIATVILIAVAVALGIAVAVWAGALTGGLQKQEKLIINSYVVGGVLKIAITNQSPGSSTITQVLFNQQPATSVLTATGTPAPTGPALGGPWTILSGNGATLSNSTAALPGTISSGITYPITVVTAAGNSYPSVITWP